MAALGLGLLVGALLQGAPPTAASPLARLLEEGRVAEARGDLVAARSAYQAAVEAHPRAAVAHDRLGFVLGRLGDLAVIEVIWLQRINFGDGWEPMADRGSDTANHLDHVHLSFAADPSDVDITC